MSQSPTPLLHMSGVSAGYGEMSVLKSIDLDIFPSEIVALVGSNGAGKTTLLRVLSRLINCSGEIHYSGTPINHYTPDQVFALGMVQVPEGRQLFDRMSVQDNLLMGAYHRRNRSEVAQDLERIYTLFPRMAERRKQIAGSMSGGEQQMCAMARAMMAKPTLLMVDEMSLGLAPIIVDQLMDVLVSIRAQGVTVLLVEQDIHLALATADRGYVVETGKIVRQGPAKELIDDPALQQAYLGL
ncbi:ABC transporter ATP-binding protein [Paralcaligenes ureilyticus]|uniref:Amino acid/amide ABC transporter ATP-binding protein 2 (HAAT family) n=1 Tax=Paralcaligenes ureilyticus TaxID=627131 RepID=A0A4R3MAS0_9BURK|nr:ABC transporter ATP-binding protein [Paralcaligenes ureilyticus]TCT08525.1 amino acid/amide ABC transporter ATP-binding protein 2 (HAAT family) [Paralcaligenes ureilyticus]